MPTTATAYLLLGANLGDRATTLSRAVAGLSQLGPVTASGLYETAAWGLEDQPAFLNQAVRLTTSLGPEALLDYCLQTEHAAGRERLVRWGARTLDVDILLYNAEIIATPRLTVPHLALPQRRFALVPLAELAADVWHPALEKTIAQLLAACPDPLAVTAWQP